MRGVVEVWRGDEKILEEPNMLVDGAGELLADIMTVSPSLSGVEDHATSSILDASNYMIQAMSFGTASEAFQKSSRDLFQIKLDGIEGIVRDFQRAGSLNTAVFRTQVGLPTYVPNELFVQSPNPSLKVLSENSDVSSSIPISGEDIAISSLYPGNGQHLNFMPSAIRNAITDSTVFSTSAEVFGNLMGSFPAGISEKGTAGAGAAYFSSPGGAPTGLTAFVVGSFPNEASSMDISGFLTTAMSSVPNAGLSMADLSSGLCLSAPAEETNKGFSLIEYSTELSKDDVWSLSFFGGIYHIGLWSVDMQQSLLNGNTPPFAFSVLNNPRKYRLFCRKGLSKDLTFINSINNYANLTIKWRIHFR
jgi:hypothetical protein